MAVTGHVLKEKTSRVGGFSVLFLFCNFLLSCFFGGGFFNGLLYSFLCDFLRSLLRGGFLCGFCHVLRI